jgi:hypothetical protein
VILSRRLPESRGRSPDIVNAEGDAMRTRTALLGFALVAVLLVLGGLGIQAPAAAATPISQCMIITEPGAYELVQNVQLTSYGDCLTVQSDFVTIDLKGYAIFSPYRYGTGIGGVGRGLVVRGGTIYNFATAIRSFDGVVVEQMRVVSNNVGVDGGSGAPTSNFVVKDSVFSDNSGWAVIVTAGVVTGNSFTRNGTGVMTGGTFPFGGNSATIANNTFSQNNVGIQAQGPTSIQNNMIEGGYNALSVACPAHIVGNTVLRSSTPVMFQNGNIWECTFDQNSIRQF